MDWAVYLQVNTAVFAAQYESERIKVVNYAISQASLKWHAK